MENNGKRILYSLTEYEGHNGWSSIGFSEYFDIEKLYKYITHRGYAKDEALDKLKKEIEFHCQAAFVDDELESCHVSVTDSAWLDIYNIDTYEQNHGFPYDVSEDVDNDFESEYDNTYFKELESYKTCA